MIHEIEQDKDWYCIVWYDDDGTMHEQNFSDENDCINFLLGKRNEGFSATAYYNTELSWVLPW